MLSAPPVGLEPTTLRLTAACSTDWAKEEYFVCVKQREYYIIKPASCQGFYPWKTAIFPFFFKTQWNKKETEPSISFQRERTLKTAHSINHCSIQPTTFWLSPRPISNSQLHTLPYFHLCPIYLVVFKGSYYLTEWDISSWGGLHA